MEHPQAALRIQRVRHEARRRDVEVARVERIGPNFISVTFTGESLADFASPGFDDHVKFILPEQADGERVWRDFTPRRFDAGRRELVIDFALHDTGPASDWARQAAPGQRVTIGGPRGSMLVPLGFDWHLLVGDASSLPAIERRLAELPAGTRVSVLVELADEGDRRELPTAATLDLRWIEDSATLVQAVEALTLPPGEGFVWCGGEYSVMATLRRVLLADKGHPRYASRISSYWRLGSAEWSDPPEAS